MRVLHLTPGCFDKGGISRYTRYQIAALREIVGAQNIRVASLLGPDKDSIEEPFEVDFHASGVTRRDKAAFVLNAAALALRSRPTIVHAAHVNLSSLAIALAASVGAATLLNVYGLEVWSGLRRDAAYGLGAARHVISDCHFTARYLETAGLRAAERTEVIWDCVDTVKFAPGPARPEVLARYGIPDPATGVNVLTLGRMTADASHKGYERLLDVFTRIAPDVPALRLVYAGRGELSSVLRERAEQRGLGDRVFFTGPVHERDLPDVYRCAHVFSLVSDRGRMRGEGIPLTPLEGASCGLPILVGNHDGSQEAVIEGVNGHVLDPFDLDAHGRRLIELTRDETARRAMAAAARLRIEREFAYERFVREHRALLQARFADRGSLG